MAQTIQLVVNTGKPQTTQTFDLMQGGVQGQAVRIQAVRGARYQLQDPAAKNTAPKNLRTKRVGKNLHLMLDGSTASDLIIEGYYDLPAEAGGQGSVYGRAEDGKLYEYVPQDSGASHTPMALIDGAPAVSQTLGGLEIEDYELSTLPVVATGGGLGGLTAGVLGAAAASAKSSQKTDETAAAGLAKIEAYNNGNGTTPAALTVQDYTDAGVTGVTANNLAAVNAQVLAAATGGADTVAELQSLVTAANNAIAKIEAYNNGDGTTPPALTLQDYVAAGVSGVNANNLAAVNAQVLAASTGGADTVPEMQTLVTAWHVQRHHGWRVDLHHGLGA